MTTSYIHLRSHVNPKSNLPNNESRKHVYPYRKFQTGSTTTFSGYTNISTNKNIKSFKNDIEDNNLINSKFNKNTNNVFIPSLMSIECFQQPPRKNRRSYHHAQQYKDQAPLIEINYPNDNDNNLTTSKVYQGIILSDSMCKYVRPEQVSTNNIKVTVSFESGCDCNRMLNFLEQISIEQSSIFKMDFIVLSLCTNDVANLGPEIAIKRCRYLIQRVRQLFPNLKAIGWLALSPRWKPSKLFDSSTINDKNQKFNQLLQTLSRQMNFEVIHANLQHNHMHHDGLHPSIRSGRILLEKSLHNWFIKHTQDFHLDNVQKDIREKNQSQQQQQLLLHHQTNLQQHHKKTQQHQQTRRHQQQDSKYQYHHQHQQQKQRQIQDSNKPEEAKHYQEHRYNDLRNNKNHQRRSTNEKNENQYLSIKKLISNYPHFLRYKDEFFRKIVIPTEFEKEKQKENIFELSNLHFQTEFLKLESEKWKIYIESARNKKQRMINNKYMDTIIIDDNTIPIARPSHDGLTDAPAPLDLSDFSEIFDEWLPDPIPGQKRKIGHRRDDPPTPPSPRQPPPIIPRRTLPPRNNNVPLTGGSVQSSPFFHGRKDTDKSREQKQYSFHALLPLGKETENKNENIDKNEITEHRIRQVQTTNDDDQNRKKESSMAISPIQSSTPEPMIRSPSVIPKDSIDEIYKKFEFIVIPIECRYHFKRMKQRCTFENIKAYQNFLENKYKELENIRENALHSFFTEKEWTQVISFVKNTIEKVLEKKKQNDQKRIDNLLLDHTREKAEQIIKNQATQSEQNLIEHLQKKYMRILDLKFQLDKLELRFVENMPPPSLNIFDKLQLYAKELQPNDNQLNTLRVQWKNVLRKTKLDLTALMRQAKIAEIEYANEEHQETAKELPQHLQESYENICQVIRTRHNQFSKRKLNFLAKRACATSEN